MPISTLELDDSAALLSSSALLADLPCRSLKTYLSELRRMVEMGDWSHPACSLLLPSEKTPLAQSLAMAKKIGKPSLVIVVGIGGSNLGTLAVAGAVLGPHHNLLNPKRQLLFADTVDGPSISAVLKIGISHLQTGGHVVLNVISKSGSTLETAANFEFLLAGLGGRKKGKLTIVATTDEGSALWGLAQSRGYSLLPIPKNVGGRYSVFSNVSLFPLALMGVDVKAFLSGALSMRTRCLSDALCSNPAAQLAALIHAHAQAGRRIHNHFIFSPSLHGAGLWYRQLMGESVGKEHDKSQMPIRAGVTPTVSIGSVDLHSMAQLYLGGPDDKFYRFMSVERQSADLKTPKSPDLERLVPHSSGKKMSELMDATLYGTQAAYMSKGIPFVDLRLADTSPRTVGALLQLEMTEIMLLAYLMNVNAFDQPAVEAYKKETKRILAEG
ncbi:Glucose-6-phosphate isomerase [uncultured archaeon]|nr:Glucose-6-phosphate isomerase [uncultured archaeon]